MKTTTIAIVAAMAAGLWSGSAIADTGSSPDAIVEGVTAIVSGGSPGPIYLEDSAWWPIVGSTSASQPSLFAAARVWQQGRVVVLGHDGIMANPELDGDLFRLNLTTWLADGVPTTVHYTSGHGEWLGAGNLSRLADQLAEIGATLVPLPAPVDADALADVEVLIVGNAWGEFAEEEIEVVHQWVAEGGGLALPGLGWSWRAYHPGQTMEDYPMMRLAAPFGIRWLNGVISDPKNNLGGSAVFDLFHPDVPSFTIEESLSVITSAHDAHGSSLAVELESDAALRREYVLAHQLVAIPTYAFPDDHPERSTIRDAFHDLLANHGEFLRRDFAFDRDTTPTAAWLRERFWRTLLEATELDESALDDLIALGGIGEDQADLLRRHRLLLMDNVSLDAVQRSVVTAHLDAIPPDLHNLRVISVVDLLGTASEPVSLRGRDGGVNIFGFPVGAYTENQFPDDAPVGLADVFSVVVAHEITHSIDAFGIGGDQALRARRDALIERAGPDPMNYLRSMLPEGFFVNAPQEFVASIANQWFTDTRATISLGLSRFAGGRVEPLNQAIFMMDVLSEGGSSSPIYTTTLDGTLSTAMAWLERDRTGAIITVVLPEIVHHFERDRDGWIVSHESESRCVGDLWVDGAIDGADLAFLAAHWGDTGIGLEADLDHDGLVSGSDLATLLGAWGICP